jgi:hypothetical protein
MRLRFRSFRGHIDPAVWPGALIGLAFTFYGLGMIGQPGRFSATPAYGNVIEVLDIRWWGVVYLTSAVLFIIYTVLMTSRLFGIITHTAGLIVTGVWWLAFIIRWLTDANTTIVNVTSWLVLLLIIGRSATLIPVTDRSTPTSGAS